MWEFKNKEEAFQFLREHEIATNCRYSTYKASKDFGRISLDVAKKVYWEDPPSVKFARLKFTGVPYVILGQKTFDCRFGRNRKFKKMQEKWNEKNRSLSSDDIRRTSGSRKIDCPAKCIFREIGRFPKYQVPKDTSEYEKRTIAVELLDRIYNGKLVVFERVILVHLAKHEDHTCHSFEEEPIHEPIDPRLARKIQELCFAGVTKVKDVKPLLRVYVQEICTRKLPDPLNKRFYPSSKCISNHVYKALRQMKNEENKMVEVLDDLTHPSVRIKGTETNYVPVQCFDPICVDKSPHMHCPFCVKTESYVDPVILKAHYRVKHVDKGIEFAGLKILRCCDRCDIVGVIKGEKKFKGAHWHCYKCRNGFNRRDEAIKHYKTHFRNPQTTFQIQIAQDINQPVNQPFETEEAAACIPTDNFSVHSGLTEASTAQTSGVSILPRGLEGMVAMPGVGAVETVGMSDTQTIMIIQDDGHGNLSTMQELCTTQDSDPPDLSVSDEVEDSSDETVQQLREKIAQLEKEKAEQTAHIALLSKKIEEQAEQIAAYKLREQGLIEQMQQLQQGVAVPQDTAIQDLCNQLETQHKQLIRQQITQLKHSLVQTSVHPKMIVLNANALGAQLGQAVNLQTFDSGANNPVPVAMSLNFNSSADVSDVNSGPIQTSISDLDGNSSSENRKVRNVIVNSKSETLLKDTEYSEILVHDLQEELSGDNPIVENDGNICDEPQTKRRKEK